MYGRPGQWDRWVQWQAEARKARQEAKKAAMKKREERMETIAMGAGIFFAVVVLSSIFYYIGVRMDRW